MAKVECHKIQQSNSQSKTLIYKTFLHKGRYLRNKDTERVWECIDRDCKGKIIEDLATETYTVDTAHSNNPHDEEDVQSLIDREYLLQRMLWELEHGHHNESKHDTYRRVLRNNPSKAYCMRSYEKDARKRLGYHVTNEDKPLPGSFENFEPAVKNDPMARCNYWKRKLLEAEKMFKSRNRKGKWGHTLTSLENDPKKTQQLLRQKRSDLVKLLKEVDDLEKLTHLQDPEFKTRATEDFYLGGGPNGEFQVFGDRKALQNMQGLKLASFDGTFSGTPIHGKGGKSSRYYQLWVFFGVAKPTSNRQTLSSVQTIWVLMRHKSNEAYKAALKWMVQEGILKDNATWDVMCDFEIAERSAIEAVLKKVTLKGCYYHYTKRLYKNLRDHGLAKFYKDNTSFMNWVRQFMLLALAPIEMIPKIAKELYEEKTLLKRFEEWKMTATEQSNVRTWIAYWRNTWENKKYKISAWAVSDIKVRTNDMTESQNASMKHTLSVHATLWIFIEKLQEVAADSVLRWEQFEKHGVTNLRKPDEREKNVQLIKARGLLEAGTITVDEFFERCSKAFHKKWQSLERMDQRMQQRMEQPEVTWEEEEEEKESELATVKPASSNRNVRLSEESDDDTQMNEDNEEPQVAHAGVKRSAKDISPSDFWANKRRKK